MVIFSELVIVIHYISFSYVFVENIKSNLNNNSFYCTQRNMYEFRHRLHEEPIFHMHHSLNQFMQRYIMYWLFVQPILLFGFLMLDAGGYDTS